MSKEDRSWFHVGRSTPAQKVHLTSEQPVIIWLTVCPKDRKPWLTQVEVQEALHAIWIAYWKYLFTRIANDSRDSWQRGVFHHRLRSRDEFREKWLYMMENPEHRGWSNDGKTGRGGGKSTMSPVEDALSRVLSEVLERGGSWDAPWNAALQRSIRL